MTQEAPRLIESVAVIGVGNMGGPMARHVHEAGFALTVCDPDTAALQAFAGMSVNMVGTPVECANNDVALILVATPAQLRSVVVDAGGLLEIAPEHRPRYIVVASTVAPRDMYDLAAAFAGMPTRVIDAPVSGGVVGAQKATLTFLVGGAEADVAVLRPLFMAMGTTTFHCGPLGAGQTTKTINNIIAITNLMISAEAYAIAGANGLALEDLIPALEAGSGRNFLSRDPADPPEIYAAWSGTERVFESVQAINRKDIDLALALSPQGMKLPAIRALRRLLDEVGDETLDHWRTIAGQRTG